MPENLSVTLKTDKVATVAFRHPWVFSGALVRRPDDVPHGSTVRLCDTQGRLLGVGTYSAFGTIAVRVFEFGPAELNTDWFIRKITEANQRRCHLGYGEHSETTGYRVVFGEADGIPGLVVDKYGSVLVMQISTAGLDHMRQQIIDALIELFEPLAIVERSDIPSRKDEHIPDVTGVQYGGEQDEVQFLENGLCFVSLPLQGQKTGFYLDQKDLRREIRALAKGKEVLNLFCYTGSAGAAALAGNASSVHQIDASEVALHYCARQLELNNIDWTHHTTQAADVFKWLGSSPEGKWDMVVIDPPALIKSQRDMESGRKAYHFLNRAAMRLVRGGGLFVTSSCSSYFNEDDFMHTLRRASVQDNLRLDVLKIVHQSADHPVSIYFPESAYLKTFICLVR